MILTDKAKEDFIDYLWESKFKKEDYKEYEDYIDNQKESHTYADIIEWFDIVGVYICLENHYKNFGYKIQDKGNVVLYDHMFAIHSRQEATKQAILRANQIYNESKN